MASKTETAVNADGSDYGSDFTADEEVLLSTLAQHASDQAALPTFVVTSFEEMEDEGVPGPRVPRIAVRGKRKQLDYPSLQHFEATSGIAPIEGKYDSGAASCMSTFLVLY